ncbi:ester cyclase [Nocardia jiangxiensis]|uniref:Ester cyclase n=1 Tax=Nocardia jiangxiensis TaxID=282685 RepID=A0ABW6S0B3_9NOCA|nr:ester cyclase [Nocardia jiangxiensis]
MVSGSEEDLIRGCIAALNSGDVAGYLAGFSPDALRWVDGLDTPLTLSDVRESLSQMVMAFDRLHLQEDLLFGCSGHACARWTLRGVHTGVYGGIAPTHREIDVQTCEVYAVVGDRITESRVYGDALGVFTQLSGDR